VPGAGVTAPLAEASCHPQRLTLADLVDGGGVLELSARGEPLQPLAVVEVPHQAEPELLARATAAARTSGRVLVGLAPQAPSAELEPLIEALAFSVVPGLGEHRSLVGHPEPEELLADLSASVVSAPRAAVTLVRLLRLTSVLPVQEGLVAESLAYSTLLAGPEFAAWRQGRASRPLALAARPPVLMERDGGDLLLTLDRADRHNAFSRLMRDALVEGLELAVADSTVTRVELRGNGASFCSGGDLDEFGTTPDVATAHVIRVERSAGALLSRCRDRVVARVHGACIGAGVELASFAGRVEAHPQAFFQLPELSLGLVPGAGGTVSVTRRVGRWRTAFLALTGCRLDAATALDWGLVDAVDG
jgi:hypothetical protein